jgi:hypothetical protein
MKAYFNYFPISAPEEDQDDRNMLYYLYTSSVWFHGARTARDFMLTSGKSMGPQKLGLIFGQSSISKHVRSILKRSWLRR